MRAMILTTAVAALTLAACSQGGDGKTATTEATETTFAAQPDLAEGVEALPRLVGDGAAVTAINADLARIDGAVLGNACEGGGGIERGIAQPMTGPGYVTFWIAEGYYCEGSAHPSNDQTALTYDLATGQRVDWVAAAPGLQLTLGDATGMPATYVPGVSSQALSAFYSRRMLNAPTAEGADAEWVAQCREVFAVDALADTSFKIWLDAQNGGVSVAPNLAHVVQACGETVTMTQAEMQEFGVPAAIVQAVTAGHAAGNWSPKE